MLQITEDTPPDMLSGAMDLTVHLPTGKSVKMAVERSTPMMDLLVQITAKHQLQLSNYTLQALGMAPSAQHSDAILPYKPNTPIGTLDTQHVKVVPKSRTLPVPKNIPPGHQPFESTFRLKVHLPRNQLYVTRVSRNVLLEDIMKEVCEEKNLNPSKYELKHPGNLDEVLNPKLTLSDYQITEIYIVLKGAVNLSQAFSSADIMALRKEEERKQMHNKTGGGVFNLIFRRGKSSLGSGSLSSDNRSISPTQSDDSRSVTPPNAPQIMTSPPKKDPPLDKPKPPQRKRRPAPKPPIDLVRKNSEEKPPSNISVPNEPTTQQQQQQQQQQVQMRKTENGLTICHSRNSSDSSGYHEASVLSENCHTSLPRRPKSAFVSAEEADKLSNLHSQSTTNLAKMSSHSKSTTSLGVTGRKKKAAPPPPTSIRASNPAINVETPSPVVASQQVLTPKESLSSQQALDSLASLNISDVIRHENKCFGSTDSGIAQEAIEKISEPDDDPSISPPPPPLFDEQREHYITPTTDTAENAEKVIEVLPAPEIFAQETKQPILEVTPSHDIIKPIEESTPIPETIQQDSEIGDLDWQYQLPSPPKAFRDSSPVNLNAREDLESHSFTDFKDSVVTSPELFEKLKNIEDTHSEKDTISSDLTSIVSEEEKAPLLNTLSLENLEKRKSLVYNRVLATSLRMTDKDMVNRDIEADTFSSSLTKFETTFSEFQSSSQSKSANEIKFVKRSNTTTQTLPNFRISTYDKPKEKIKVFEDDTVRSNMTNINKMRNRFLETETSSLKKSYLGRSMENISVRKNSIDNQSSYSNEEKEYILYKPEKTIQKPVGINLHATRSGSFSRDPAWSTTKPVSRSKSHLNLNGNRFRDNGKDESISRSNSFYEGLQSLGVMRLIQNKLNTPTSSMENVSHYEKEPKYLNKSPPKLKEDLPKIESVEVQKLPPPPAPKKIYRYQGPPSINMSTWSERPKVPVAVKEDADYTLGKTNNMSSKLIVNTTNNNVTSNNTVEIKNLTNTTSNININGYESKEPKNVNVTVNGSNNINNNESKNVVIKIGSQQPKTSDNQRFINHTTAIGYRKPFNNINANNQRPHSIALDSNFDISRVPVVRSVELKKPFKDINNTSVTQIYQNDNNHKKEPVSELMSKFSTMNRNNDAISNRTYPNQNTEEKESKPIFRVNSLKPQVTPVVRGFNSTNNTNRFSWNPSNSYTLPTKQKEKDDFSTNIHVPFSQSNLRRTESSKIVDRNLYNNNNNYKEKAERPSNLLIDTNSYQSLPSAKQEFTPPPAPSMSKLKPVKRVVEPVVDPRDQLLSAIRNFGGKKGLKSVQT